MRQGRVAESELDAAGAAVVVVVVVAVALGMAVAVAGPERMAKLCIQASPAVLLLAGAAAGDGRLGGCPYRDRGGGCGLALVGCGRGRGGGRGGGVVLRGEFPMHHVDGLLV